MSLMCNELEKLEELSQLTFSQEEKEKLKEDLEEILNYVNILQEVDTAGIEPMTHIALEGGFLREDIADNSFMRGKILENAPCEREGNFVVPNTVSLEG